MRVVPLFLSLTALLYLGCAMTKAPAVSRFPVPLHGGTLREAVVLSRNGKTDQQLYVEVVRKDDTLNLYPYVRAPKEPKPFTAAIPSVDLKEVLVRLGSPEINTLKSLPVILHQGSIEARLGEADPRLEILHITFGYKKSLFEATLPLPKGPSK